MEATIEIVEFLALFFFFCSVIGAIACGVYFKKKQKLLYNGIFLGLFTGLLAGMVLGGAAVFLWLGF